MANKVKPGLIYFPFEVNFFKDIKIRKLIKYQGCKATPIYTLLLCNIYENGYYLRWDNELPFMISEITGYEEGYIREVFNCCLKIGLFSEKMFLENKVITSTGIQERYQSICKQIKKKSNISEFNIINTEEFEINTEEFGIITEELTQRKEKKIKEKESKVNKNNQEDFDFDFMETKFSPAFVRFLDYRKKIHKEFKTQMSLEACYRNLIELSCHDPTTAESIVEQSIANQWQGLFELKEKNSAKKENGKEKPNRVTETIDNATELMRKRGFQVPNNS